MGARFPTVRVVASVLFISLTVLGTFAEIANARLGPAPAVVHPSDWCPEAELTTSVTDTRGDSGPTWGYTGDTDTFSYDYTNTNGNAVSITAWDVSYSWISAQQNLGSASVPGDGSHVFTDNEVLPGSAETATITVSATGQASGDWFSSTCSWNPWDFSVTQLPSAPTVIAQADVTSGTTPFAVSFSSEVSQGLGPFSFAWTFGDGATAVSSSASHTYESAGTFDAQVVVTDERGRSSSNTVIITVAAPSGGTGGGGGGTGGSPNSGSGGSQHAASAFTGTDMAVTMGVLIVVVIVVALVVALRRPRDGAGGEPRAPVS